MLAGTCALLVAALVASTSAGGERAQAARPPSVVPVEVTEAVVRTLPLPTATTVAAASSTATVEPLPTDPATTPAPTPTDAAPTSAPGTTLAPVPTAALPTAPPGGRGATNPPARPVNVPQGELVCPIAGDFWHVDDYYAPRVGGTTHYANDLIAEEGVPVVAISDGYVRRIDRVNNFDGQHDKGGITITFDTVAGDIFYYAHLAVVDGQVQIGSPISAGEVLGLVGQTGNAAWSVPHLHLSWRPGRGEYANPYPLVRQLCGPHPPKRG